MRLARRGSVLLEALACVLVVGLGSLYIMQTFRTQQSAVLAMRDQAVVINLLESRISQLAAGVGPAADIAAREEVPEPLEQCSFVSAPGEALEQSGNGLAQVKVSAECTTGKRVRRLGVELVLAGKKNDELAR
ncbi:MAG: hypothetical protein HQL20_01380 [Candidatus Omnitrophica bacterium]|nr:hypothetical protein [Candidatus Omnitrophota bacterium]